MDSLQRAVALGRSDVLAALSPAALLTLAERAERVEVAAGEPLPLRTDAGDAVLVVVGGVAVVGERRLGAGELVGADAALTDAPPPDARAAEDVDALRLWRDDFLDLVAEHPAAARRLASALARRLRAAGAAPAARAGR